MPYRWKPNPAITKLLGQLSAADREDFWRVYQGLEDDPRSIFYRAMQCELDHWTDVWCAPFGHGGQLVYRILDDSDPPELEPLHLHRPDPGD